MTKKKKRSQRKKHNRRWAPRVLLSPSQFSETKLNLKANWTWKQTEKVTWLRSQTGVLFYSSQFSSNFSKFLQPIFWVQTEKSPTIANRCPFSKAHFSTSSLPSLVPSRGLSRIVFRPFCSRDFSQATFFANLAPPLKIERENGSNWAT